MVRRVEVVPPDPGWSAMFDAEARDIATVLGQELVAIHHIGSTAIPGIKAKPVIDIMVEVRVIEKMDDYDDAVIELGYQPMGEYGIPGRRFFRKPDEFTRTRHVHVYGVRHPEIPRHLNFRDYLTAHPEEAQARGFPEDTESYTEGKSEFIRGIDAKARAWAESTRRDQEAELATR